MSKIGSCYVCKSLKMYYAFSVTSHRVVRCEECGFMTLNPQPTDQELAEIYSKDYFLLDRNADGEAHFRELKQKTADHYLDLLDSYGVNTEGRLLEIGCGEGDFAVRAAARGFHVTGVEYNSHAAQIAQDKLGSQGHIYVGEISALDHVSDSFDVCILSDVIEHVRNPNEFLSKIRRLLKPDGVLFVACPSLDSWSAKFLKEKWVEFKPEHLHYFNSSTLHSLLFNSGFRNMIEKPGIKTLSFDYIAGHFSKFPVKGFSTFFAMASKVLPKFLKRRPLQIVASGTVLISQKKPLKDKLKLSLVIPAYNEANTISSVLEKLLVKTIEGLDIELVIVESNSKDGTREIVQKYADHPRVKLVLQEAPKGKGFAVREGLKQATGDFILIQDADNEYDLEDYDVLLEPLIAGRNSFVLGSRHGGKTWKLRAFQGDPLTSAFFNLGHQFFTFAINFLFRQKLKDPFTMYKVFRRDCLYGLNFECNRFDFDFELLIKLVRKGYHPVEIPVNYRSRSFDEGKKVTMIGDPLTWIRALVKFRLQKIDPLISLESKKKLTHVSEKKSASEVHL